MANIPSPVVGAGGQGSRPWYEQLLLTLASQGPGTLMQWLEHRQVDQQRGAIDTAAQASLAGMAPSATPDERITMQAGGMQPGLATVPAAKAGGINMPAVSPMTAGNQANFSGMKAGVAPALLEMMRSGRTAAAQQGAAKAQTTAAEGSERRAEAMHSGDLALQDAQKRGAESAIQTSDLERRLTQIRVDNEPRLAQAQLDNLISSVGANDATTRRANAETNTIATNMATAHRQEFQTILNNLLSGAEQGADVKAIRRDASRYVYDSDVEPTSSELKAHYDAVVAGGAQPDLYNVIKERVQRTLGVTPERYGAILNDLNANDGDPNKALLQNLQKGASRNDLSIAARIYAIETGTPVQLPYEGMPNSKGLIPRILDATSRTNAKYSAKARATK